MIASVHRPPEQQQHRQRRQLQESGDQVASSGGPVPYAPAAFQMLESEYFDLNVLKG